MSDARLDLNAARAARREARGGRRIELVIGDDLIVFADELSLSVIDAFAGAGGATMDLRSLAVVLDAIFADARYDATSEPVSFDDLKARHGFSTEDLEALFTWLLPEYGMEAPPFSPSAESSESISTSSSLISVATTAPTSETPSSAMATP